MYTSNSSTSIGKKDWLSFGIPIGIRIASGVIVALVLLTAGFAELFNLGRAGRGILPEVLDLLMSWPSLVVSLAFGQVAYSISHKGAERFGRAPARSLAIGAFLCAMAAGLGLSVLVLQALLHI